MARQLILAIAESAERRRATTKKQSHRQSERTVTNVMVAENWTNHSASNPRQTSGTRWFNGNQVAAKVSSGRIVRIVGSQERTRKITPLEFRGASRITKKTGTATRLQKLWGNRGVALWETYQLNLTYPTVYHWVHYRLKAKLKVPRPKSAKQEPNADRRFKKTSAQPS